MCGGYVVGAFELYADPEGQVPLGAYRFSHEYRYDQDPTAHSFTLEASEATSCYVGGLRFGHRYTQTGPEVLWQLDDDDWITTSDAIEPLTPDAPVTRALNWQGVGLLPYPCFPQAGDVNCDGVTDFRDINPFVLLLSVPELWQTQYPTCPPSTGDINNDGQVDFTDINPFVLILVGV
jgi:hypothetical protein